MKAYNNFSIKGKVVEIDLKDSVNKEGVPVIMGTLTVMTDEEGTLVKPRFYAPEFFKSGKENATYAMLREVAIDQFVSVVAQIDVNYFAGRDGNPARSQQIRASFLNANASHAYENKWKADLLITKIREIEENGERGTPHMAEVNGYLINDFMGTLQEFQSFVLSDKGVAYALSLPTSEDMPHYVSAWGALQATVRKVVRQNAFGEDEVDEYTSSRWVLTGMSPNAYDFADETVLGVEQYKAMKQDLEERKAKFVQEVAMQDDGDLPF